MRKLVVSLALLLGACAGQPTTPQPVAQTRVVSNVPVVAPSAMTSGDANDETKAVLDAKRLGYTVVNQDGQTLYCHKQARTGSHLATETTCLTAREIEELREQTQRTLQSTQMQLPPPSGK
jgi:hypothetical protein